MVFKRGTPFEITNFYTQSVKNINLIADICTSLKLKNMARFCDLTGKGPISGNNVSHSNIKSKRRFYPNLQKKTFFIPEVDRWIELKVSTSAIRTINKKGIYTYLKELEKKGEIQLGF